MAPPILTREEWETSDCRAKKTSRQRKDTGDYHTTYSLCPPCETGWVTGANETVCIGVRCPTMKPNEMTMHKVFENFRKDVTFTRDEQEWLPMVVDMFCHSIAREWECMGDGCEYRESPKSAAHTYAMSHGASRIHWNITHYCSWFLVRKTMADDEAKRITCTIMLKLNNYLFEEGIINEELKDAIQEELDQCIAVEEDKIMKALSDLKTKEYWKNLPAEENHEAREITDENELYDDCFGGEFGLTVIKVNNDGWDVRAENFDSYYSGEDYEATLRLPPNVSRMGRAGMRISCMDLGYRSDNGVLEPYNDNSHDKNRVFGNVYPLG
jgi:hypothetical protein